MAVVIVDVSDSVFSVNGIEYQKHFQGLVLDNLVKIVNIYDSKIEIVGNTNYTNFTINGSTFGSAENVQSALVPILFNRDLEGIEGRLDVLEGQVSATLEFISISEAMAVNPLPPNNVPFTVRSGGAEDGHYIYDSAEVGGYLFKEAFKTPGLTQTVDKENETEAVTGKAVDVLNSMIKPLNEKILSGSQVANFSEKEFNQGYLFGSSGAFIPTTSGSNYATIQPLPLIGGVSYEYSSHILGNASIVLLKEDGVTFHSYITGTTLAANSYIFEVPLDAYFIKVTALISDINNNNVFLTAQDSISKINSNTNLYNVTNLIPLTSGYYTDINVLSAIPVNVRKLGLRITYQTASLTWATRQYIGDDLTGWLISSNWISEVVSSDIKNIYFAQKKILSFLNRDVTIIAFDSVAKTITFPADIQMIDKTIGRVFVLGAERIVNMGGWFQGLIYYNLTNDSMNFRGTSTIDETEAVYDTYHKLDNLYIVAVVNRISSGLLLPSLHIDANYYSVDGNIFGGGQGYVDGKVNSLELLFGESALNSEWYIGNTTLLTTTGSKSVMDNVKDIWFDFIEGKPEWWDSGTFQLDCVFRHDYTGSPTSQDTMFQFVITKNGVPYGTQSFYRWEIEIKGDTGMFTHTKRIILEDVAVLINIRADISAYASTIPIPRNDTTFNLFSKLKTTSIYKEAEQLEIINQQIYYGGSEIFTTDKYGFSLYKRGLTINDTIKEISLCTKTLPLLADYVATPNDPSALQILRDTSRNSKMPIYKYGSSMVELKEDEVGDLVWLNVDSSRILNKKYGIELSVKNKNVADIVNTSINAMCFGASSTELGLASYTKILFEEYGLTLNGVGTKYDYFGTLGEGRGGWSFAAYVGISSKVSATEEVDLPTETATITEWNENPFLYLATASDKTNKGDWCFRRTLGGSFQELSYNEDVDKTGDFYIFDFVRYMANRNVTVADVITIQLGMNDYYSAFWSGEQKNINVSLALDIIYSQIREYSETLEMGVITYMPRYTDYSGYGSVAGYGLDISNYVNILNDFILNKTDDKFHVINTHCLMNPDLIFDQEEGNFIDDSGNSTKELILRSPDDGVHFQKNGYIEFSRVVGNFILNKMS